MIDAPKTCRSCGADAILVDGASVNGTYVIRTADHDEGPDYFFRCFACRDDEQGVRSRMKSELPAFLGAMGLHPIHLYVDEHTPGIIDYRFTVVTPEAKFVDVEKARKKKAGHTREGGSKK